MFELNPLANAILMFLTHWFVWATLLCMGVTVGYHRLLTHRGFKTHKFIEYFFVTLGYLALEGTPSYWVGVHRIHHAYSDQTLDPHSPLQKGWWYGQIAWLFDKRHDPETGYETFPIGELKHKPLPFCDRWCPELVADPYYRFMQHPAVFIGAQVLSYGVAFLLGGFIGLAARFAAAVSSITVTGWVNSYCHVPCFGASMPFQNKTKDESRNVWWVALATMGEGWHNNHHAFQKSARHGLEWWQLDVSWMIISSLKLFGLVWDVYCPDPEVVARSRNHNILHAEPQEALLSA